jgi:hsp70-interacting protein
MVDLSKRLQDINETLAEGPAAADDPAAAAAALADKERLLEELVDLVENIDLARDLSAIGGLPTLVSLLGGPHASLRWRAAEVAAACAQNHPDVQAAFMAGGVLPALWPLLDDADATCRVKGLLGVSCMVRGHAPAMGWFAARGGAARLAELAGGEDARAQRKALQLLRHLVEELPQEGRALCGAGSALPARLASLLGDDDADVRAAALGAARQLAGDAACAGGLRESGQLRRAAEALQCRLDSLPREEWAAAEEELEMAKELLATLAGVPPSPAAAAAAPPAPAAAPRVEAEREEGPGGGEAAARGMQLATVPQ